MERRREEGGVRRGGDRVNLRELARALFGEPLARARQLRRADDAPSDRFPLDPIEKVGVALRVHHVPREPASVRRPHADADRGVDDVVLLRAIEAPGERRPRVAPEHQLALPREGPGREAHDDHVVVLARSARELLERADARG